MKKFDLHKPLAGLAVPVSALRSADSCGIGEFLDLKGLGTWCSQVGLSLIQILPVNDTGSMGSPYSALSAFALNPIYIRLQDVPGITPWLLDVESFQDTYNEKPRTAYRDVLAFKDSILHAIFNTNQPQILANNALQHWIATHDWIKPYAVYYHLKQQYAQKSWLDWPAHQNLNLDEIGTLWEENKQTLYYYAWVQYHLEKQFVSAVEHLETDGIYLKGDIPILMNDDSADVWAYRQNFNLSMRAGAPPDMFATTGQHWGFPTYDWAALEATDFAWWRARLKQAEKFYHAYRIDHVLGFFRIWSVQKTESTAILGYYRPASYITRSNLQEAGFSDEAIYALAVPHLRHEELVENLGDDTDRVCKTPVHQELGPRKLQDEQCARVSAYRKKRRMSESKLAAITDQKLYSQRSQDRVPDLIADAEHIRVRKLRDNHE
jgi:4-alpha-glucanotransferase